MAMWKASMDEYITIYPVLTTSFIPIVYSPPGSPVTVHIVLYLPTSGQESDFVEQVVLLTNTIIELHDKYPGALNYLRGESNVNPNNKTRYKIFSNFLKDFDLVKIPLYHNTYHHFMGNGLFDSEIDVIVLEKSNSASEIVEEIICSRSRPEMSSHHDIIISSVRIDSEVLPIEDSLVSAPRVPNTRQRISWSDTGILGYQDHVSSKLQNLRSEWSNP